MIAFSLRLNTRLEQGAFVVAFRAGGDGPAVTAIDEAPAAEKNQPSPGVSRASRRTDAIAMISGGLRGGVRHVLVVAGGRGCRHRNTKFTARVLLGSVRQVYPASMTPSYRSAAGWLTAAVRTWRGITGVIIH